MITEEDKDFLLKEFIRLREEATANAQMAFDAQQAHEDFMDQHGETWIWIHQYENVLQMLHYVAKTAKEMGCDIPPLTLQDKLWWEPLQEKDE